MKLRLIALALLLAGCGGETATTTSPADPVPVFLISIDTLRSDRLPVYGYDGVATPGIDRFRRDAVLFEHAYSNVPMTLPSHTSIFSGRQPYEHGVRDNIGYPVPDGLAMLPSILQQNGYATGGAISSYVLRGETGIANGFDFYDDVMTEAPIDTISSWQRDGALTAEKLAGWLDSISDPRVFGFLHIYEPHYPYTPPEPHASAVADGYDGEVARADEIVGGFLDHLRERGLYDQALIILLSDHGEGLGDHGELEHGVFLYRESIQVPLLIKLPGGSRGGETVTAPVSLTDVLPTVLSQLGVESPETDGTDVLSQPPSADRAIYSETYYPRLHYGWSELFSLVDGSRHLIDAPSVELYDHRADPGETINLSGQERRAVASMRETIRAIATAHPFEEPSIADPEDLAKLESLGYLGGSSGASTGDRPDPKEKIELLTTFGRGAAAFQRGELDRAIEIGRAIVGDHPDFLQGWGLIASASQRKGDLHGALNALEAQMERSRGNPQTALGLSSVTFEMKRFDEARTYAELATDYAPSFAWEMIARIELARNNLAAAEEAAREAARAAPNRAEPLMLESLAAHRSGDFASELSLLDRARSLVASGKGEPIAELEFRRGQALLQLRRPQEAREAFRAETAAFPNHRMAWVNLALVTGAQGNPQQAEAILASALEANPDREMRGLVAEARQIIRGGQ